MKKTVIATLTTFALPCLLSAIITESDVFEGTHQESFESFAYGFFYTAQPIELFDGAAQYYEHNALIYSYPGTLYDFGLGRYKARTHDGTKGLGESVSPLSSKMVFDSPITSFGGYFGGGSRNGGTIITFFDEQNEVIDSVRFDQVPGIAPDYPLLWYGWDSTVPISSIQIEGGFLVMDSLRIDVIPDDVTPPTISDASTSPSSLWPPNGKMVPVTVNALVEDDSGEAEWWVVDAYSSQPEYDKGDIKIVSDSEVLLRARRDGRSGPRVYTLLLQAVDDSGNSSEPVPVEVVVPHDQGKAWSR